MNPTSVELWHEYTPGHGSPMHTLHWEHGEYEDTAFRLARTRALEWNRGLKNAAQRQRLSIHILVAGSVLVDVKTGRRWTLDNQPLRAPIDDGQQALPLADTRQPTLF